MTLGMLPRKIASIVIILPALFFCNPVFSEKVVFADGLVYNDFYTVTVHTVDGESFTLFDVASFEGETAPWPNSTGDFEVASPSSSQNDMKYFFWVRRMGATGAITYPLSFRKILEINFVGPYGRTVDDPAVQGKLVIDGETSDVSVFITGKYGRNDENSVPDRFSGWFGDTEPIIPSFTHAKLTLSDGNVQDVFIKTDGFLGGNDEEFGTYAMLWIQHDGIKKIVFNHNGSYARCPECGAVFYNNQFKLCPFDGAELIPPRERP